MVSNAMRLASIGCGAIFISFVISDSAAQQRIEAAGGRLGVSPPAVAQAIAPTKLAQATATSPSQASGYEIALRSIAGKIASRLEAVGLKSGAVLDFTDLQGQGTELGRFLAQELSDQLVTVAKSFSLVDRANLRHLAEENKLLMQGVINPESSKRFGNMIGIDTVILGTVTPIDGVRLSVRAVAVETGKIVAAQSISLPLVGELSKMHTRGVALRSLDNASDVGEPDIRARFRSDSIKAAGRFVSYGRQNCPMGGLCATASFVIENLSGVGFNAAIKGGSISIGPCVGSEVQAAGLRLYNNAPGWTNNVLFESAQSYIPANAKIPVTVTLDYCSATGGRAVDVSVALTISVDGKAFDIPLSVSDVPVR